MKKINNNYFKKAMAKFATGITVITINDEDNFIGKTVSSFSSLSLTPPLILFSLDKKSSSLSKFIKNKSIGINILSNKQKNISIHFSKKDNKWDSIKYYLSNRNIPMIKNSLVNLSCKNTRTISAGDHIIFVCEIIEIDINIEDQPLIYLESNYLK